MISFRYHIVSIVAVFLALALGIVIGTTALNGPITTDLRKQVDGLKSDRATLAQQVKSLQGQVSDSSAFAAQYGSQIVAGRLSKSSVLLIGMPGASSSAQDGIEKELTAAGAKLSGRLQLTSSYVDPRRGSDIVALATNTSVRPIGLTLPEVSDPGQLGGALLSYVLVGHGQPTDLNQVLGGFSELHMVSVSGASVAPSTTIVVVGTGAMPANDYGAQTELSFVTALQQAGGHVVVAGNNDSASQAGLIAEVRGSSAARNAVSTVDDADLAIGQVSTVLALAGASGSRAGHYGTAKGAEALFPNAK